MRSESCSMIETTEIRCGDRTLRILHLAEDGFCRGVRGAVETALQTAEGHPDAAVVTLGEVVHNPLVVERLRFSGVRAVHRPEDVPPGAVVIIRSHGVAPEIVCELLERGAEVVDATCPKVRSVQRAAERHRELGEEVVVIGHRDHPEVQGVYARCGEKGRTVCSAAEAEELPWAEHRTVLFQTTFDPDRGERILEAVRDRTGSVEVKDTLCHSVSDRRKLVRQMVHEVECLVVVGGRNSSNTTSLVNVGEQAGIPTFHVEGANESFPAVVRDYDSVAVVGGTSTPEESIDEVRNAIISGFRQHAGSEPKGLLS